MTGKFRTYLFTGVLIGVVSIITYGLYQVYAINTQTEGYQIASGGVRTIDAHGVCARVKSINGRTQFVATKSSTEWSSFRSAASGIGFNLPICCSTLGATDDANGSGCDWLYTSTGTYTWTVPAGVTSVSVVVVGGGGGGDNFNKGGGGGGLRYKNNISVSSGQVITIQVGAGGVYNTNGGTSYFSGASFLSASGGGVGYGGKGTGGDGGGDGGGTPSVPYGPVAGGGGGGAGGYSGNGGSGSALYDSVGRYIIAPTSGSGGGGGGGDGLEDTPGHTYYGYGGGGVGLYGLGANGSASLGYPGGGGSSGQDGLLGGVSVDQYSGSGGRYGGGAGAPYGYSWALPNRGGDGAVRIIYGSGRTFPSNAQ